MPPNVPSQLVEILQRRTTLSVCPVTDGLSIEANRVYVLPPAANATLTDRQLYRQPTAAPERSIDMLFHSLAVQGDRAIGILL